MSAALPAREHTHLCTAQRPSLHPCLSEMCLPHVSAAERRQAEAGRIREKYPDRIPVSERRAPGPCRYCSEYGCQLCS